jgi:DEAD/DEAH box helicase domain-containing protein
MQGIESFITQLISAPPGVSQVRSHLTLLPTPSQGQAFPAHFPAWLSTLLGAQGLTHLSQPQGQTLQLLHQGQHVCLSIPTGSGRGVLRLLAMYQAIGVDRHGHALFIFPQKHRELAQLGMAMRWSDHLAPEHRLSAAIYDGDTPGTQRRQIKQAVPHLLLTTPEMLHAGILAYHSGWRTLFQNLRLIVLADLHLCASALLTHLAHLLRRAYRLANHYGSHPQFLLTSTPFANPEEVAQTLTGRSCEIVYDDTGRRQLQHRVLLETHQDLASIGRHLLASHRDARLPTLFFAPPGLRLDDATMLHTPEDVQRAEQYLLQEDTAIVLPHDTPLAALRVSAAHSMVFLGLPSSFMRLHDALALLANGTRPSLGLLVLTDNTPLERYLLRHPAVYTSAWLQGMPLALSNPAITRQHLLCATAELALAVGESYAGVPHLEQLLHQLAAEQAVMHRSSARQWVAVQRQAHRHVYLRWYERPWTLINQRDAQTIARLAPPEAFRTCFEEAQYIHRDGSMFQVERDVDERRRIVVRPSQAMYRTRGRLRTAVNEQRLAAAVMTMPYRLTYGWLDYTESLSAYERLEPHTLERQSVHLLPEKTRQSRSPGIWLDFPGRTAVWQAQARTALHTLVHAVMAGLPLLFRYHPGDLRGGLYTSEREGEPRLEAVFIDAHAGGSGLSAALYQGHAQVLRIALHLLLQCDCPHGCSHCLHGLQCNTCEAGEGLDRQAGIALLQQMLGETVPPFEATKLRSRHTHATRQLYLSLTTQKSAEEVGGWQHKHLLGLGLAMLYDTHEKNYYVYTEETVDLLLARLRQADLIIGFNTRDFDYQVLQAYTETPLPTLPTCAMLDDIQKALGYRINFRHIIFETLGSERPDDSLDTLQWYREGDIERLLHVCRRDVDWLRDLMRHGSSTGTLHYRDRSGTRRTLPVSWQRAEDYEQPAD